MIPGPHGPEWAFPVEAIEALANRADDRQLEEEPPIDNAEQGMAALMREVVSASKMVHATAAEAIRAAVEAIKGTDHRTSLILQENKRLGEVAESSQRMAIDAVTLVKDLIIAGANLEAESIKSTADQTIRVERTKVAARGIPLFGPIVKKGLAHALGAKGIEVDAQGETVTAVMEDLRKDGKLEAIGEVLDEEQRNAVELVMGATIGRDEVKRALRLLKSRMTPEQGIKLSGILSERQMTAIGSLFEFADEDEEKPEPAK